MTGALVTLHYGDYARLAEISWTSNKLLYANRWRYDAIAKTDNFDIKNPGFAKIALMLEVANQQKHDWLYWSGTDLMITNFTIPITEFLYPNRDITISIDFNHINADSFVIRNTDIARKWLSTILDLGPKYMTHHWYEQQAMIDIYNEWRDHIQIVPQRFLNSYQLDKWTAPGSEIDQTGCRGIWCKGDFALHFCNRPNDYRLERMTHYLTQVIV